MKNLLIVPEHASPSMDAEIAGWKYTVPVCPLATVTDSLFFPNFGIPYPSLLAPTTSEPPPESATASAASPQSERPESQSCPPVTSARESPVTVDGYQ